MRTLLSTSSLKATLTCIMNSLSWFTIVSVSKLRNPVEDGQDQQVSRWRHSTPVIQYLMSYLAFVILMGLADSNWGAAGQ